MRLTWKSAFWGLGVLFLSQLAEATEAGDACDLGQTLRALVSHEDPETTGSASLRRKPAARLALFFSRHGKLPDAKSEFSLYQYLTRLDRDQRRWPQEIQQDPELLQAVTEWKKRYHGGLNRSGPKAKRDYVTDINAFVEEHGMMPTVKAEGELYRYILDRTSKHGMRGLPPGLSQKALSVIDWWLKPLEAKRLVGRGKPHERLILFFDQHGTLPTQKQDPGLYQWLYKLPDDASKWPVMGFALKEAVGKWRLKYRVKMENLGRDPRSGKRPRSSE